MSERTLSFPDVIGICFMTVFPAALIYFALIDVKASCERIESALERAGIPLEEPKEEDQ